MTTMTQTAPLSTLRIVTEPRGTWRWQDAYAIARYEAARDRRGAWRWYSQSHGRKLSMPQLLRLGHGEMRRGSIHRALLTTAEVIEAEARESAAQLETIRGMVSRRKARRIAARAARRMTALVSAA